MVGTGILPNNMRSPSPICYTPCWRMTLYSDTLHWRDITPIFPFIDLDLITEFDFLLNCVRFPQNISKGAACQQMTFSPSDTWSCPTLGLACVLMSRPISPKLVLFPDFWVRLIRSVLSALKFSDFVGLSLILLFGCSLFRLIWASLTIFLNFFVRIRINDEGWIPGMRIWSILLIKSD